MFFGATRFCFLRRRSQEARQESAKLLFTGSSPVVASKAGVVKLADTQDLKSCGPKGLVGSSPTPGTKDEFGPMAQLVSALP